ncbi:MAG: methyltransferase domain-containing protein, partial [Verrucomicrobiae bacterium]|nr:methyltransferase domain-containing protein [Verrucomicrobiae bacterium]
KEVIEMINENSEGIILDCGAGLRRKTFPNVVNFEPVPYSSTDVQGVAEALPFRDNCFDVVLSFSVLEHVKDPFRAAREMIRVLKPGGYLHIEMPFLIQEHGFPHHYCNMTTRGLANLVEDQCTILDQQVPRYGHPVHALVPLLQTWCDHLDEKSRKAFKNLTVGELLDNYGKSEEEPWITALPQYVQKRIAAVTRLVGIKKALL